MALVEWFADFYAEAQAGAVKPVEGVVRAGELLFVPRGWWHMAINLEARPGSSACVETVQCCRGCKRRLADCQVFDRCMPLKCCRPLGSAMCVYSQAVFVEADRHFKQ